MIGVVRNPNANKNRRGKNPVDVLKRILQRDGIIVETKNRDESLEMAVESLMKSNVDVICSDGGDGSVHYLLTKVIECYSKNKKELPLFVPLASGTVNFAAKSLGLGKNPAETLEIIVRGVIDQKETKILNIVHNEKIMYGFVYGMGAIPNFLEKYYDRNISGFLSYETSTRKAAGLILKGIVSLVFGTEFSRNVIRPVEAEIETGNYRCSRHTAVVSSTLKINVVGLKPFHAVSEGNGGVYILCGNFEKSTLMKNIPNVFLGKRIGGSDLYINKREFIKIKINGDCNFTIDGELYKAKKGDTIKLTAGPSIRVPEF